MTDSHHTIVAERRAAPRLAPKRGTRCACRPGTSGLGPDLCAGLRNLSRSGACLLLRRAVRPGSEVEVVLTPAVGSRNARLEAEVVWAVDGPGGCLAGVRFRQPLEYHRLADFAVQP